jgi:hypothetical protein
MSSPRKNRHKKQSRWMAINLTAKQGREIEIGIFRIVCLAGFIITAIKIIWFEISK